MKESYSWSLEATVVRQLNESPLLSHLCDLDIYLNS